MKNIPKKDLEKIIEGFFELYDVCGIFMVLFDVRKKYKEIIEKYKKDFEDKNLVLKNQTCFKDKAIKLLKKIKPI